MKKIILVGCGLVVFVLICASLPSALSYQIIQSERDNDVIKTTITRLQKQDLLRTTNDDVMHIILEKMGADTGYTIWQPGLLLVLFVAVLTATIEAISQGNWFPGMVFGSVILYLVLIWIIIFGQFIPSS